MGTHWQGPKEENYINRWCLTAASMKGGRGVEPQNGVIKGGIELGVQPQNYRVGTTWEKSLRGKKIIFTC